MSKLTPRHLQHLKSCMILLAEGLAQTDAIARYAAEPDEHPVEFDIPPQAATPEVSFPVPETQVASTLFGSLPWAGSAQSPVRKPVEKPSAEADAPAPKPAPASASESQPEQPPVAERIATAYFGSLPWSASQGGEQDASPPAPAAQPAEVTNVSVDPAAAANRPLALHEMDTEVTIVPEATMQALRSAQKAAARKNPSVSESNDFFGSVPWTGKD